MRKKKDNVNIVDEQAKIPQLNAEPSHTHDQKDSVRVALLEVDQESRNADVSCALVEAITAKHEHAVIALKLELGSAGAVLQHSADGQELLKVVQVAFDVGEVRDADGCIRLCVLCSKDSCRGVHCGRRGGGEAQQGVGEEWSGGTVQQRQSRAGAADGVDERLRRPQHVC